MRAALSQLLAQALVEQRDEEYALVDPLFAEWVGGLRETGEAAATGMSAGRSTPVRVIVRRGRSWPCPLSS